MHNPLTLKLERVCGLGAAECAGLSFGEPTFVDAHEDILADGQVVSSAKLMLSGIAQRFV